MSYESKNKRMAFPELDSSEMLIKYLESADRRNSLNYLHHYTSLNVAIEIIHGKQWHLCSAKNMNDRLEYDSGDIMKWENILFSSFMGEDKESIAMWSMYGQPWEKGVKISIPTSVVHKWLSGVKLLREISTRTYKPTGNEQTIKPGAVKAIALAYTNYPDIEDEGKQVLRWSNVSNDLIQLSPPNLGKLTGYLKNKAWSYEKEHRIIFDQDNEFERGSIDIPDEVIDKIILTPSPLFEGDFLEEVSKAIERELKVQQSIFHNKLNISSICDKCTFKKPGDAS